jgi:DNA-binding transcriptional regulator YdaS (Cro superfamily)
MIEAATSGRAKCKGCKKPIDKGELRYGHEVEGNFDGAMTFWYHLPCAVTHRPEQFRVVLARYKKKPIPNRAKLEASLDGATVTVRARRMKQVERAPTGRASCQQCKLAIAKDTLRAAVWLYDMPMAGTGFVHVGCVGAWAGSNIDTQVIAKAVKADKAAVTAILQGVTLLDSDARGKMLELGVQHAKKPAAEIAVLADWLEERGCTLPGIELGQLLATRKKTAKKPKQR